MIRKFQIFAKYVSKGAFEEVFGVREVKEVKIELSCTKGKPVEVFLSVSVLKRMR